MTDKQLMAMSKDEANRILSYEAKVRWVALKNYTANLYTIRDGNIVDVLVAGWWHVYKLLAGGVE